MISEIVISPRDPDVLQVPDRPGWLTGVIGVPNATTRPGVIGHFLLVHVGELCSERDRAESEHILRLQPFLANATVTAVPDTLGGVRIEVATIDEVPTVPTVLRVRLRGHAISALRIGNANVGGQGLYLAGSVERRDAYRTGFGLHGIAYQVLGGPNTLAVSLERTPLGGMWTAALGHPFLTDLQRSAWHAGYWGRRSVPVLRPS